MDQALSPLQHGRCYYAKASRRWAVLLTRLAVSATPCGDRKALDLGAGKDTRVDCAASTLLLSITGPVSL